MNASAIAHKGHTNSGIQSHSCGNIFPLRIDVVGGTTKGGLLLLVDANGDELHRRTVGLDGSYSVCHDYLEQYAKIHYLG